MREARSADARLNASRADASGKARHCKCSMQGMADARCKARQDKADALGKAEQMLEAGRANARVKSGRRHEASPH
jgi:hypothetical protein